MNRQLVELRANLYSDHFDDDVESACTVSEALSPVSHHGLNEFQVFCGRFFFIANITAMNHKGLGVLNRTSNGVRLDAAK